MVIKGKQRKGVSSAKLKKKTGFTKMDVWLYNNFPSKRFGNIQVKQP